MPDCPKCKYEYKPGVETCPDCGEKLVAKLNDTKRAKDKAEKVKRFIPEVEQN